MTETGRILTTHVGSLPRSDMVSDVVRAVDEGAAVSEELFDAVVGDAVDVEVERQARMGIDIVSDGEMSKITYASYIRHRLTGFSGDSPLVTPADLDDFPGAAEHSRRRRSAALKFQRPVCSGPVSLRSRSGIEGDVRRIKAAAARAKPHRAFLTAASPGLIAIFHPNRYYPTHVAYLHALAAAMGEEYRAIVAGGLDLQIDCPDLAMGRHTIFKAASEAAFLRHAEEQIEALNSALVGLPAARLRIYVSWGNYEGPHTHDIPLERILPLILKVRASQILFEAATPRHQHEWRVFKDIRLPDDKVLVPGVIDVTTNYVEHPEVVAERIERFASVVGRDRVIASTDSGFAAFAGDRTVDPKVAYAKLESLVRGAEIASRRLWG